MGKYSHHDARPAQLSSQKHLLLSCHTSSKDEQFHGISPGWPLLQDMIDAHRLSLEGSESSRSRVTVSGKFEHEAFAVSMSDTLKSKTTGVRAVWMIQLAKGRKFPLDSPKGVEFGIYSIVQVGAHSNRVGNVKQMWCARTTC
jgi:hypothetical protein